MAARGLLDGRGAPTAAGRALRAGIEDRTDQLAVAPYAAIGTDRVESLLADITPVIQRIAAAGEIIFRTPWACRFSSRDSTTVDFERIGPIRLPRAFLDDHDGPGGRRDVGIDHAYAVTSYAVQGATFDLSTSRIDQAATA